MHTILNMSTSSLYVIVPNENTMDDMMSIFSSCIIIYTEQLMFELHEIDWILLKTNIRILVLSGSVYAEAMIFYTSR